MQLVKRGVTFNLCDLLCDLSFSVVPRYHLPLWLERVESRAQSVQGGGGKRHQARGLSDQPGNVLLFWSPLLILSISVDVSVLKLPLSFYVELFSFPSSSTLFLFLSYYHIYWLGCIFISRCRFPRNLFTMVEEVVNGVCEQVIFDTNIYVKAWPFNTTDIRDVL